MRAFATSCDTPGIVGLVKTVDDRLFLVGDADRSLLDHFRADAEELLLLHPGTI